MRDGDVLELGNVTVKVLHTPGHTPEHICLLVTDRTRAEEPWFVFTGHTLMVGDLGRTELATSAEDGARDLFGSVQRLKALPDYLEIFPGAYSGSVCGRSLSGKPTSTIGFEKRHNKAFGSPTKTNSCAPCSPTFRRRPRRRRKSAPSIPAVRRRGGMNGTAPIRRFDCAGITLGLRENWQQFSLLVLINAFVGGMVGLERTVIPLIGSEEFKIASTTIVVSFIVSFGVVKALANLVSGHFADVYGRKAMLVLGWLVGLPVPFMIGWGPSWSWIVAANALLGINQGFAWSMTVIMKVDLVGPKSRGLAVGLNEFAGYLSVGVTAFLTGYIAQRYGLRPAPFYLGIAYAVLGLTLSILLVRDTRHHVGLEIARHSTGTETLGFWEIFRHASFGDRNLFAASQAGLVNNLNYGMSWGIFPCFSLLRD